MYRIYRGWKFGDSLLERFSTSGLSAKTRVNFHRLAAGHGLKTEKGKKEAGVNCFSLAFRRLSRNWLSLSLLDDRSSIGYVGSLNRSIIRDLQLEEPNSPNPLSIIYGNRENFTTPGIYCQLLGKNRGCTYINRA